jgi:uncharacterized membrane protein YgcG
VLLRTGKTGVAGRGGAAGAALLLSLAALALFLSFPATAQAADSGTVLEGSGIRYPGGFDPNTVGEIRGRASGLTVPKEGPVRFRLDTGRENYTVLASPPWYWKDLGIDLPDGSEVLVRGSKTLGKDMNLYVIAQEIRLLPSSKSWTLRDEDGFPRWKGHGGAGSGSGAGGISPMRRGGGGGGGMGGGGRRR